MDSGLFLFCRRHWQQCTMYMLCYCESNVTSLGKYCWAAVQWYNAMKCVDCVLADIGGHCVGVVVPHRRRQWPDSNGDRRWRCAVHGTASQFHRGQSSGGFRGIIAACCKIAWSGKSTSSLSSSLCLLRNIVKSELLDKRKRAGWTRQTDNALTAKRA